MQQLLLQQQAHRHSVSDVDNRASSKADARLR